MIRHIVEFIGYLGLQGYLISQIIMEGIQKGDSLGAIIVECVFMFILISFLSLIIVAVLEGDVGADIKASDMVPKYSPYGRFLSRMESIDKKENTK